MIEVTHEDIYLLICGVQHEDFYVMKSSEIDPRDCDGFTIIEFAYKNTLYTLFSYLNLPVLHQAIEQFGLISIYAATCGGYVEKYLHPLMLQPGINIDKFTRAWELINPLVSADIVESTVIPPQWDFDILFELYINELIFFNNYDTSSGQRTPYLCPILITNDVFFPAADGYTIPVGQEQLILEMYNKFNFNGIIAWASIYTGFTPRKINDQYNGAVEYLKWTSIYPGFTPQKINDQYNYATSMQIE